MNIQLIRNKCKTQQIVFAISIAIFISGCAVQPSQEEIKALPVIQLGDTIPENGEYVLFLPAGKAINAMAEITGDIFQQEASQTLSVTLKQDIYSYKNWISYDKVTWLSDKDALAIRFELKLPSYQYPYPGKISLQISEKNK